MKDALTRCGTRPNVYGVRPGMWIGGSGGIVPFQW